jgi:hypothetical protein
MLAAELGLYHRGHHHHDGENDHAINRNVYGPPVGGRNCLLKLVSLLNYNGARWGLIPDCLDLPAAGWTEAASLPGAALDRLSSTTRMSLLASVRRK